LDTNPIPVLLVFLTLGTGLVLLVHRISTGRRRRWEVQEPTQLVTISRTLFPVLLVVLLLRSFLAEPFRIPSSSMQPTLAPGDFILVNKYRYGLHLPILRTRMTEGKRPERGDVVVFFPPGQGSYFIKRVVGLPGDRIRYQDKRLYINGRRVPVRETAGGELQEKLAGKWHPLRFHPERPAQDFFTVVQSDHYFMMGDNRDNSQDSRVWGQVPEQDAVGPALLVWMHWQGITSLPSFRRVRLIQ